MAWAHSCGAVQVTTIPGVLDCKGEHFWTQAAGACISRAHLAPFLAQRNARAGCVVAGKIVGSVCVRVQSDAAEQVSVCVCGVHDKT